MIPFTDPVAIAVWAVCAAVVAIYGTGRIARLVTYDDYPPTIAIRKWWAALTRDGGWSKLASCFWCFTPWAMLVCLAWFALGLLVVWIAIAWWLFFGWLALSYITSMVVARDEPPAS